MKTLAVFSSIVACLSVTTIALGQTPQAQPLVHSFSAASMRPATPEQLAILEHQGQLDYEAATDLHARRYAQAEAEARQAMSLWQDSGLAHEVLGNALEAQGKNQEALETFHALVNDGKNGPMGQPRALLPYALMLLKSGQWAQAVLAYNNALPSLGHEELEQVSSHFTLDTPNPTALAVAIHLERGQLYNCTADWAGEDQNTEAMSEYAKALQLAPDYDLANYYYGVGWQKLSPAERVKFGNAQQAKAALQNAVKIGTAEVKAAAERALKNAG